MRKYFNALLLTLGLCVAVAPATRADSAAAGYDIRILMGKFHPFAAKPASQWDQVQPGQPARPAPRPSVRPVSAPAAQPEPTMAAAPRTGPLWPGGTERGARASSRGNPLGGILAEVSIGGLNHDDGPFSNSKEGGYDVHLELRFASPKFLDIIWSPEPHIGANINSEGDTSQVFAGLSYEWNLWRGLFAGISVGGAYHNGETDSGAPDKKDLGCHLLFRESLTLGWQLTEHHKIAAIFDHISNAKICDHNEGLENLGLRYSYRF